MTSYYTPASEVHDPELRASVEFVRGHQIPLWQSLYEMEMLVQHMRRHGHTQNDIFVELGSFHMGSTYVYSTMFVKPGGLIISVDLARPIPGRFHKMVLKTLRYNYNVVMMTMSTEQAVEKVRELTGNNIDYLHIDADHRYEGAKRDFENYSPMVKSGGVIQMHDIRLGIGMHNPEAEVFRLWNELQETHQTYEFVDEDYKDEWLPGSQTGIGLIEVP